MYEYNRIHYFACTYEWRKNDHLGRQIFLMIMRILLQKIETNSWDTTDRSEQSGFKNSRVWFLSKAYQGKEKVGRNAAEGKRFMFEQIREFIIRRMHLCSNLKEQRNKLKFGRCSLRRYQPPKKKSQPLRPHISGFWGYSWRHIRTFRKFFFVNSTYFGLNKK